MEDWILFIFVAQTIWSLTTVLDKFIISKGHIKNPLVFIQFNAIMNVLVLLIIPFIDFQLLSPKNFLLAFAANALLATSVILYYKACQYEEISRIAIFFQTIPVLTFIFSLLFIGETLSLPQMIGFTLLIAAGVIVSIKKTGRKFKVNAAYSYLAIASILTSISAVMTKYLLGAVDFWNAVSWFRIMSFAPLILLLIPSIRQEFTQSITKASKTVKALISSKMVIDFTAFFFADFAILLGPVSLVSALSNTLLPLEVFLITVIISIYFPKLIKEDLYKESILPKVVALVLVIIGILLVNL